MPASKKERQSAKERIQRTEAYADKVRQQFASAVKDILALNKRLPELKEGQMYSFDGAGKKMHSEVDSILRELHSVTVATVRTGITQEWAEANKAVDEILASALGRKALSNPNLAGWFDRNEKAMDAFLKRTQDGFNLSRRIWNTTTQLREEMEVAMTVAIGEGESASAMSRRVRQYLNDPDLMFRRFRYKDDEGNWQRKWKKKVVDSDGHYHFVDYDRDSYKVGAGQYKSAYKNAMRVTRTETNIAYRRADHERWQQLDFVLGQRIQTSNSHPKEDICDELAGEYPKDFVFDGWHPQCFCICTPIMADEEEMKKEMEAVLNGEDYEPNYEPITTYPEGFQKFVEENAKGISNSLKAGTAPYFVANNEDVVQSIMQGADVTDKGRQDITERVVQALSKAGAKINVDDVRVEDGFARLASSQVASLASGQKVSEKYANEINDNYVLTEKSFGINNKLRNDDNGNYLAVKGAIEDVTDRKFTLSQIRTIQALDEAIARNSLSFPVRVVRNIDIGALENACGISERYDVASNNVSTALSRIKGLESGATYQDAGYTSFSFDEKKQSMGARPVSLTIDIPAGKHLYITNNAEESEGILGRNVPLEIRNASIYKKYFTLPDGIVEEEERLSVHLIVK